MGSLNCFANIEGDGYYRVRNKASQRYIYVDDNKGSFNSSTTYFDLGALTLWKDTEKCVSNPACIIYVKHIDGMEYDFLAQGTGVSTLFDRYPRVMEWPRNSNSGEYRIYGSDSGLTKYLSDAQKATWKDMGSVSDHDTNLSDWHLWQFLPVDNDDQFFGINPTFEKDGVYYASFFAAFPIILTGNMEAYAIEKADHHVTLLKKIESGEVPASTPVIIKCDGSHPADNKVKIESGSAQFPEGMIGTGVYFNTSKDGHTNRVAYDPTTMRVPGVTSDGRLGLVTPSDMDYVAANTFYVKVGKEQEAEMPVVDRSEYDEIVAGIADITADGVSISVAGLTISIEGNAVNAEIFDITGKRLATVKDSSFTVPAKGIYLIRVGSTVRKVRI